MRLPQVNRQRPPVPAQVQLDSPRHQAAEPFAQPTSNLHAATQIRGGCSPLPPQVVVQNRLH
jgi:hypothetical protein